jgi:hypothetical protein
MANRSKENQNRIWIELERHNDDAVNVRRAELATTMLRRLGDTISKFWWHEAEQSFCITIDSAGSYLACSDNGHWFSLDFLGKEWK